MRKSQPKTNAQVRRIFGLANDHAKLAGYNDTREFLADAGYPSVSSVTFDEANNLIKALGGDPFSGRGKSIRMQNYRKQVAGVKTIETDAQLKLIGELAAMRGWSDESLQKFCQRVIKKDAPVTTEEGNKIVEGLKAMNRRDKLLAFKPKAKPAVREPGFRRVA